MTHHTHTHHQEMIGEYKRRFWNSLVLTAPIIVLSPLFAELLGYRELVDNEVIQYILLVFATAVFAYGGKPFIRGFYHELKAKEPGMMTLIGVAITTAYVYSVAVVLGLPGEGFFWELATLIDIMLLGHWVEMRAVLGASKALEEITQLLPAKADKIVDGKPVSVSVQELLVGDHIIIKPGGKIPADSVVIEGKSNVNEAALTGESTPIGKQPGEQVTGGSINGEGSLTVEVQRVGKDSFIAQVMALVQQAQESRSRTQNLSNRVAALLTTVALGVAALTFIVWSLTQPQHIAQAVERAVTVMVIACPHALGLAIPLVVAISATRLAQNGLLVRDRDAFENARAITTVIFDKTGTLTTGIFAVQTVKVFDDWTEESVLKLAAAVEARSEHPIARAIVKKAGEPVEVVDFKAMPGEGVEGRVEDKMVRVVNLEYLSKHNIGDPDDRQLTEGFTTVFVVVDETLAGAIGLADSLRPEAKQAIDQLRTMNMTPILLTGDNKAVAKQVAHELGIDEYFAEVLPDKKSETVQSVQARGQRVAMVGDGVNDAPALAQADVGIAIGAGTDVAAATADVILVKNNLMDVARTIRYAQSTYAKMVQNLWWAAGYNVVAIPLAAGVLMWAGLSISPAGGAILMTMSTLVVAINARLLRFSD